MRLLSTLMTTSIKVFTQQLVSDWCLGDPDLVNMHAIRRAIRTLLRTFDRTTLLPALTKGETLEYYDFVNLAEKVQVCLVVIKVDYISYCIGTRGLDLRINEMDVKVQTLIDEFFKRRHNVSSLY